jgi:polar amino acid transport system permease protein
MNFSVLEAYQGAILGGLWTTMYICALSIVLGLVLGLAIELVRQELPWMRMPCRLYVEFFRGSPILIQIFLIYYAGPHFGLLLSPVAAGVVGLALYGAAYYAEIFRSGFEAVPKGQIEAAECLGISPSRVLWRIKLPQMAALVLPPLVNQSIILIKDSAVLSVITVPELTKQTSKIINETFTIAEPLLVLALLYWALVEGLSRLGRLLETSMNRHITSSAGRTS